MGKDGGGNIKVYYGSVAGVVCAGPVDELVALVLDGATIWPSNKYWADGISDLAVVEYSRKTGKATLTFATAHGLVKGQKISVSGCADGSFNTAGAMVYRVTSNAVTYTNAGADVAGTAGGDTVVSKVVHYTAGEIVGFGGGMWQAVDTHDGTEATRPPSAHWTAHSVKRAGSPNPYPFTVTNYGQAYFYWGLSDQVLDAAGEKVLASNGHPPYRRQAVVVLKDFMFGQERQAAPNIEVVVRRAPTGGGIVDGDALALDGESQANMVAAWAELVTDAVFGLGLAAGRVDAVSWQAVADWMLANAAKTYGSICLDKQEAARGLLAKLLAYFDGWMRFNGAGAIEAGRFLHDEAPPAFDGTTTIDYTDLQGEIAWDTDGWASTFNTTQAKFKDRARAFTDASRKGVSGLNLEIVGEPRTVALDRPWIARELQAASHAVEYEKINAQPNLSGSLVVREEKAAAIGVGDLFLLTHDALAFSVVCRCTAKSPTAPPAGTVTLDFSNERGIAPVPYHATLPGPGETVYPPAESIDLYQLFQPPAALSGKTDFELMVLAARTTQATRGLKVWLRVDDAALYYELGMQRNWAVKGALAQDYAANLPADGTVPADDDTETLQLNIDGQTVVADLEALSATQTDDAVNDDAVLVVLFDAADATVFEICTLKAIRLDAGVYKLKVRRQRFATTQRAFVTGDVAWIVAREDLQSYTHARFGEYATSGTAGVFRLQAFTGHDEADLTDATVCPDVDFTFTDAYAPRATWTGLQRSTGGGAFADIADFTAAFLPADIFKFSFSMASPQGTLIDARLVARSSGVELTLWHTAFSPTATQNKTTTFSIADDGTWGVYLVLRDAAGRVTETALAPVGGGGAVSVIIHGAAGTVLTPVAFPAGTVRAWTGTNVTLSCGTAGATIYYQVAAYGAAYNPAAWVAYGGPVAVAWGYGSKRLYYYATHAGMTDSGVGFDDYGYERSGGGNLP